MEHYEIPDLFKVRAHAAVVFADQRRLAAAVGEVSEEEIEPACDQVNRRGLQRLDEAGGQSQCQTIAAPDLLAVSGAEGNQLRLGDGSATVQIAHQVGFCRRIRAEPARIDVTLTQLVAQGNAPAPAGRLCAGPGVGMKLFGAFGLECDGPIAGQVV